ncbi:MAG: glutamate 5-kinase [Pseudomonadales bacterium]
MSAEVPQRTALAPGDCLVLKVGSALLTHSSTGLARERIEAWAAQIAELCDAGIRVVVVSSGAVAEGCVRLGLTERPRRLHRLQAAAAVGQVGLTHAYEHAFAAHKRHAAMVLLTHDDLSNRVRYLNARTTLTTLLDLGVVPIVNENDTVATDEIRFGDNDTLAAMVANLLQAELLLILTNQQGLHTKDPIEDPLAPLLPWVSLADPALDSFAGDSGGEFGRGGMITKIQAARTAANSGARTVIADGMAEQVITRVAAAESLGTLLTDERGRRAARKGWILSHRRTAGEITVDAGAETALQNRGVSLLPVGAVAVQGEFSRGDLVRLVSETGRVLGQGLVNYSSAEVRSLLGHSSDQIVGILGYCNEDELINRDNMALHS